MRGMGVRYRINSSKSRFNGKKRKNLSSATDWASPEAAHPPHPKKFKQKFKKFNPTFFIYVAVSFFFIFTNSHLKLLLVPSSSWSWRFLYLMIFRLIDRWAIVVAARKQALIKSLEKRKTVVSKQQKQQLKCIKNIKNNSVEAIPCQCYVIQYLQYGRE